MSLFSQLKKFDIYRDVPKDLTEQTLIGAIVSVVCGFLVFYLFLSEFVAFLTVETVSEMYVDPDIDHHNHATISIRMNFTVPRMPCAVTSVDVQDVMGSHIVDYGGKLHRWRTDSEGNLKFGPNGRPLPHDSVTPIQQKGEGCNVEGHIIVKQVPGNFHVSAHAHGDLLGLFYDTARGETLNCTHYIHHLMFGDTDELMALDAAAVAPLNGGKKVSIMEPEDQGMPRSYEYYIKVVPTKLQKLRGEVYDSYQFTSNSNHILGRFQLPAIYFRYDFSPITVKFEERKNSFAHFLVQICAIIGGVFTVLGLVNGVVLAASKKFKANINKLG
jgi:hypothetical protein